MTSHRPQSGLLACTVLAVVCGIIPVLGQAQQSWTINTFAGGGPNHVPAAGTAVGILGGVAVSSSGTFYIASSNQNQVWKLVNGKLVLVAGTGVTPNQITYATAGDGGPATKATLSYPQQIATGQNGDLFIPDFYYGRVRKVSKSGLITLVAGNGVIQNGNCVFDGDGIATQHAVCPFGVVTDAQGNFYISGANRIRKVDSAGNMTTIAGSGAVNVYGQCVFDGDGPATQHALCLPTELAFDRNGSLYIADTVNQRIRKLDSAGTLTTVAGNGTAGFGGDGGPAVSASLNYPSGVTFDTSGNLYIGDAANSRLRRVDANGIITTIAGNGSCTYDGDGRALQHSICDASSVATDSTGNVYVTSGGQNGGYVRVVDTLGNLKTVTGNGTTFDSGNGGLATLQPVYNPTSVATDPVGNVYALDCYGTRKIDAKGNISPLAGGQGCALSLPRFSQFYVDATGNNYATNGTQVIKTTPQGVATVIAGTGACQFDGDGPALAHSLCNASAVTLDGTGNVYVSDTRNQLVRKIDTSGNLITIAGFHTTIIPCNGFDGDGPALQHSLCGPEGLAADGNGNVYVADTGNARLRIISQSKGTLTTVAGSGMTGPNGCVFDGDGPALQHSLCVPASVALAPSGDVFLLDTNTQRVRELSGGNLTTLAGNGTVGFGGDGGPSTVALLNNAAGLAVDGKGALYIADAFNNRVRKLTLAKGTTTTLTSSLNPSGFGQAVQLTAKVAAASGMPAGKVTFYDGVGVLGTATLKLGTASLQVSTLVPGSHSLTAAYSGGGNFAPSTSGPLSQIVTQATATVALLSSPNPSKVKQQVTFAVVVSGSAGTPTGSVTLKQGTKVLGTGSLANGNASFLLSFATAGTYSIVANYSGDQNYAAASSTVLKQVVQ